MRNGMRSVRGLLSPVSLIVGFVVGMAASRLFFISTPSLTLPQQQQPQPPPPPPPPMPAKPVLSGDKGMVIYPKAYGNFGVCPVDLHVAEYIELFEPKGVTVFHFGTGIHHHVGVDNLRRGNPNTVHAITASPEEQQRYVDLLMQDGTLAVGYRVVFGDIYCTRPQHLPQLDVASLPHIGEYYDVTASREKNVTLGVANMRRDKYAVLDDKSLLSLFVDALVDNGRLLIYTGSNGAAVTKRLIAELVRDGRLAFKTSYKSLDVYVKVPKSNSKGK